jgi:hypothetical protein
VKDIGYVCSGDGGHVTTFDDYSAWIDDMLYIMALDEVDLHQYRAIVIPDFSNQEALARNAEKFDAYLAEGGFLIAFEPSRLDKWLTIVDVPWFPRETEDWKWWLKPGGRLEVYQPEPKHPMAEAIPVADMSWHFFGAYRFFEGARPILNLDNDEGCVMFDYKLPAGGGRLICSSFDPHLHSGRRFMPATTRFLNRFYPWLKAEVSRAQG